MSREEIPRQQANERAIPVRVVAVEHQPRAARASGYGTVQAKRVWDAVAEVQGRIIEVNEPLRSGIFVEKGEVLLRIDPLDYQLAKEQRTADVHQAEAELLQIDLNEAADRESLKIQSRLKQVRSEDVKRLETLRGSSAASANELDTAIAVELTQAQTVQDLQTRLNLYESQRAAANARLASAQAKLKEIDRDLERTEILAPFAGLISDVQLEVGQYVNAREPLFKLLDVSKVEVEAQFSLNQLIRLFPQVAVEPVNEALASEIRQPLHELISATVIVRSGESSLQYRAVPVRVTEQFDSQTRTLGVVTEVSNAAFPVNPEATEFTPFALRPGAFCEVVLESKQPSTCITISRTALVGDSVYVVAETETGTRIRRQEVETSSATGPDIVVQHGLHEGDLVVLQPPLSPSDGLLVDPQFADPTLKDPLASDDPLAMSPENASDASGEVKR